MNLDSCSEFWENFGEIWGNPGETPHVGGEIVGYKGLTQSGRLVKYWQDLMACTTHNSVPFHNYYTYRYLDLTPPEQVLIKLSLCFLIPS